MRRINEQRKIRKQTGYQTYKTSTLLNKNVQNPPTKLPELAYHLSIITLNKKIVLKLQLEYADCMTLATAFCLQETHQTENTLWLSQIAKRETKWSKHVGEMTIPYTGKQNYQRIQEFYP